MSMSICKFFLQVDYYARIGLLQNHSTSGDALGTEEAENLLQCCLQDSSILDLLWLAP